MRIHPAVIAGAFMLVTPLSATTLNTPLSATTLNVTPMPCRDYLAAYQRAPEATREKFGAYLAGFMEGMNQITSVWRHVTINASVLGNRSPADFVLIFCQRNSALTFRDATELLIRALPKTYHPRFKVIPISGPQE